MGLPIGRITVATNANDILARALDTGRYRPRPGLATQSPAMDIQVASNFERLLFECSGRDGAATERAFAGFASPGAIDLRTRPRSRHARRFTGVSASEGETAEAMARALRQTGRLIDPHTAVALAACRGGSGRRRRRAWCSSTAHPAKFPEAVRAADRRLAAPAGRGRALGRSCERIDRLPPTRRGEGLCAGVRRRRRT